jgi:diguanylate cyclase (GGDEF)-like protein/PAS domain S-box-containing protein
MVGVERSKPEPDNVPNGASHGPDEPTHTNVSPGEDNRWLRSVVENSLEIVTIVDPDGTLRYASPAFGRVLGYDPKEAIGTMNVLDHVHLDDLPHVLEETEEALSKGGVATNKAEYRFRHRDGSWRWMESVGTYLLDDPNVRGVVVTSRDVTERKEAEEALSRSEAEVLGILESITDAFFSLDREWCFSYVNSQAEVLLNRRREDLVGERIREDRTFYPQYRRAVTEGRMARFEAYCPPLEKWFSVRAYPSESGLSVYLQDVTERKKAEERIRFQLRLLDAVGEAIIATDLDGKVLYWNHYAEQLYGWSAEEVMGRRARQYIASEHHWRRADEIMEELRAGRTWSGEFEVMSKDGISFPALFTDTPVYDERGDLIAIIGVCTDISERKQAEEALRESERRFRGSFDHAATGMALVGTDGRFLRVNKSLCEILGYSQAKLLTTTFQALTHPDDLETDLEHLKRLLAGEIRTYQIEKRYFHKEGYIVWVLLSTSLIHDEEGGPLYFVSQIQDITERKALGERLQYQAHHDLLTDLPNRQLFLDRLEQAHKRTMRHPGHKVAVLFMDLDNFKVVNDSLGHEVGDMLLVRVGERLRRCLRPEDTLARFGGDEFAMVLENVQSPKDAVRVAKRIIEELGHSFVLEGRELVLRASVGIALGQDRTKGSGDLLKEADTAMYRAKADGVGYRVFEPKMYEQALRRLKLENEIRRGIEVEEFVVNYQPLVDLQTGEVWGSEALVRWEHPKRGLLEPSQFVPVAEETGLIVPLGESVLEEACRQAVQWKRERPQASPLVVCVNLSARQLRHHDLTETVEGVLQRTGLDSRCLSLDITETLYITVLGGNTAALDDLRQMGVRISIDDFGMGYSSLSYLKRLPVDTLKIDRTFVAGLGEDVEDTAIVRMLVDLAHTLGMKIVAEGVESEEQAEQLKEMGCDLGQGYYFAKPLPPEAALEFLAR